MGRWILLCMTLTSLVVAIPEEHQYCAVRYRRLCQGKGRHVACQFPDAGPASSCEHYTQIKFTNDLKHFVTHYLNRRRQRIAAGNERVRGGVHLPKPQIMMLVEWDRELSLLAQRLADQCHFVHDDCRATVRYPYAGQTVGEVRWRRSSESDELSAQRAIRRVLDAWWGERRRVQSKQLTAPFRLTAKGTVWGHFSQLAVWNLQAVGCGAVRHGAYHPRLLLVCDFSHTNMLGQRTLVSGSLAPCPIHTARRSRTAYSLLCGPVRHPVPSEPEEFEVEENYKDYEEEDTEVTTVEMGYVTAPRLRQSKPEIRWTNPKIKATTVREFPDMTRKVDTKMYREYQTTPAILKESVTQNLDRELQEQRTQTKVQNIIPNYKQAHNTFDSNQFESIVRNDWSTRKWSNFGQWRQNQENPENLEEVIALTIPRREITETLYPPATEVYRPIKEEVCNYQYSRITVGLKGSVLPAVPYGFKILLFLGIFLVINILTAKQRDTIENIPRSEKEVYRPTIREDHTERDATNFRQRWRQTRIRPQRPGANALLTFSSTVKHSKKEFIASLNLDKEGIDQLFQDTGFNVHWRKHTT